MLVKLTSRKFWLALTAFIASVLTAFNVSNLTVEQVTLIVSGIGALVAYIFGEAYVDGKRAGGNDESNGEIGTATIKYK